MLDIACLLILLSQCAAVNFVSGTGSKPEVCTNSTGVEASLGEDSDLAALVDNNASNGGSTDNSSQSSSPTPTATPDAAPTAYGSVQGFGSVVTVALMVILGAGLMI